MSKVSLNLVTALAVVAAGISTSAFNATLTDSEGTAHTGTLPASALAADGTGTLAFIDDIPAGAFSGNVQTIDSTGAALGSPVSFSGAVLAAPPASNQQPVVTTVTVTVG